MLDRVILLETTVNTRHLGGFETPSGKKTKATFVRSDIPLRFIKKDIETLVEFGIKTVIDLRYATECDTLENPLSKEERFHYVKVPVVEDAMLAQYLKENITGMGQIYIQFVEQSKNAFRKIFDLILKENGGVFFHCTIGKDRTGTLACLLLMLAEVSESEIIQDYAVSATNLRAILVDMRKRMETEVGIEMTNLLLDSKPEYIQALIQHIQKNYGSAKGYLASLGYTESEIGQIVERI